MNEQCSESSTPRGEPVTEKIFVYGTLMNHKVQQRVIGRTVVGRPDRLRGYEKRSVRQGSRTYPRVEPGSGDAIVSGLVLEVSPEELECLDDYEGDDYRRLRVIVESGLKCWAYVR